MLIPRFKSRTAIKRRGSVPKPQGILNTLKEHIMLWKKIYIPIGLCVLLGLAIGYVSMHSDVPDEPSKFDKAVEPAATSTAEAPEGGDSH